MKANELRQGNLILGVYEQEIDRGNGIIEDVECEDVVTFLGYDPFEKYFWVEGGGVDDYDKFNPIPLTEEWLERFNLKRNKDGNPNYWEAVGFCGEFYSNIRCFELNWYEHAPCQYVHQLQNLYFALTGEELTLKK